jgi:glycosyltransferase involved in cell wall biosynthesis
MSDFDSDKAKIDAYLLDTLAAELDALNRHPVDPYSKWAYDRLRELYWTISRLLRAARRIADRRNGPARPADESLETAAAAAGPRLLLDMTNTVQSGARTGIQRVVREIARECALQGLGVPVTVAGRQISRYYRQASEPAEIEPAAGDVFVLLDAAWNNVGDYPEVMRRVKERGGKNVVVVYDILPLLHPPLFNLKVGGDFRAWFAEIVARSDAAVAISRATAETVVAYREGPARAAPLPIGWWPLGADFAKDAIGEPSARAKAVASGAAYFLAVGTLEPRKGYAVALAAFERLWAKGIDIGFAIVGRPGWNTSALQQRLRTHPEVGRRLHWFEAAGDADLQWLYAHARGAVNASVAEGFGLPIVEAAQRGVPVIASDIPVFREVGGEGARYFDLLDADSLARAIEAALAEPRAAPKIETISWAQSARELARVLRAEDYPLQAN